VAHPGGLEAGFCWQTPASLDEKIAQVSRAARETGDERRASLLMEYRRHYELLQSEADYQRTLCGMTLWSDEMPRALAGGMISAFDTPITEVPLPPLFEGRYELRESPFWHLVPVGRPGGRPLLAVLTSYEFLPASWNFFRPLANVLRLNIPLAPVVDIPKTFERNLAVDAVENIIAAYQVHLSGVRGEDSRSVTRINDCHRTLQEINAGDALHQVQISIAVFAPDPKTLKRRVHEVINETRPWFLLRQEVGELLSRAVQFFSHAPTKHITVPATTWPVTSRELALMLAPVGYRKLSTTFYETVEALQRDLDAWLVHYNTKRPHHGYRNLGKRPIDTVNAYLETVHQEAWSTNYSKSTGSQRAKTMRNQCLLNRGQSIPQGISLSGENRNDQPQNYHRRNRRD
jgi:hypothetical protein